ADEPGHGTLVIDDGESAHTTIEQEPHRGSDAVGFADGDHRAWFPLQKITDAHAASVEEKRTWNPFCRMAAGAMERPEQPRLANARTGPSAARAPAGATVSRTIG